MASVSEMLVGSALQSADKAPDIGGAIESGVGLAMKIQQVQQQKAALEQQKQEQYTAKVQKFASLYDTASKLPPSARNNMFKTVIPKTRDALGLNKEFPDDAMMMFNSAPEVVGFLQSKVESGEMTLPQLLEKSQDTQWIAEQIPLALQVKAGQDLTPQITENMEAFQKSENFRINEANQKENARITAQGQAQRAIDDDNRAGGKKLAEVIATKYGEYAAGGGRAGVKSALTDLESAVQTLESGSVKTGGISTKIPGFKSDDVQSMINPQMVAAKTQAQAAMNKVLRATLGAQFTEAEGVRIMNQVWDDRQPPTQNAKRVRAKLTELRGNVRDAEAEFKRFGYLKDAPIADWKPKIKAMKDKVLQLDKTEQKKFLDKMADKLNTPVGDLRKELGL